MRICIGASLSGAPISAARLIYIRCGGGERGRGLRKRFSHPLRDAILTLEFRYFLRRRLTYTTYCLSRVRPPPSVITGRRNHDLYLPESATP